ncbi:EAL domain-containing protein [Trabulsiella odontotermitis]|uniref:EAL domain-containing protein n=1 Tax=Trabulsiella odontotermitis TaxID=379893 RepID=UPI0006BA3451|nr:EAL domain-containing protein [Trabulsiella odontotermitis]
MRITLNPPARKFILALILCLIFIPLSRFISPRAIVDGNSIYLAWMPLSVMLAIMMLFGRHSVLPLIIGLALSNDWMLNLPYPHSLVLIACQLSGVFVTSACLRLLVGRRWRFGLPGKNVGVRIFWFGFISPAIIKCSMYLSGEYMDFPLTVSSYFESSSVIYSIVDVQSLVCAVLIFTMLFYYPMRMILNPRYARTFWIRNVRPSITRPRLFFTVNWSLALVVMLIILCAPYESDYIAGYLVPVIFILYFHAVSRMSWPFINLTWAASVFLLVAYNKNFLHGVDTEYSLAFILSVLISFTICILFMSQIYFRNDILKHKWQSQAMQDPLTGLPNLRALENFLASHQKVSICCLRMGNLDFLSRHYGMMMRVHCKRTIISELQPLLSAEEKLYQLPGSELFLVLEGPETMSRLTHIVDFLNSRPIYWNNARLELQFGASWGVVDEQGEELNHTLGQLSWLAEEACHTQNVLALDSSLSTVSDQTTERVLLFNRIKRALEGDGVVLYAQPIVNAQGEGYHEILTRLVCDGETITPDLFIPVVAQFNLSKLFDMQVLETLFTSMHAHPGQHFSVNLLPFTLMQKECASEIIALFKRHRVDAKTITIEITEEQAFSNSEISVKNIQRLHEFGCKIAIDDFGTGYANYERLKTLQADIIKIDGCFVRDIMTDSMDSMIVKSICDMAKVKNLTTVAEYVETAEQRALLLKLGVDYLQGYLLGKPRPLSELEA